MKEARILELLRGPLDTDYLLHFLARNRLQQLFVWMVRSICPDAVPPGLDRMFDESVRSSLLLTRELVRVLNLFAAQGIDALPFKGPALALEAFGNLALRSFDDLDILVRPADVWRARDALLQAGYEPKLTLDPSLEPDFLLSYDEFLLRGPGGGPLVELHWAFVPPHFSVEFAFEDCWPRRHELKLANRRIPALHTDDLLLVLSMHGAKHCWAHLGLVTDVAWLLANCPVNWPGVLERARSRGVLRMLSLAVLLAVNVYALTPDPAVANVLDADREVALLAHDVAERIFEINGKKRHDERAILKSAMLHMRMRERFGDRVRYGFRLGTRPGIEDWQSIALPGALRFLYPLLRYPRLVLKYRSRVP